MSIKEKLNVHARKRINKRNIKMLKNSDFSLVASNCNGALILHDLGLKFNSPFVNLWIKPKDFIKMCSALKEYMSCPLEFIKENGVDYPIGKLKDIHIYFQHYQSEEEALSKWDSRKLRMNYDNLFILFSDRDGCTYDDLVAFDNLAFDNKVVFTHLEYAEIKSSVYISGFENQESVGFCFEYMPNKTGQKYYDQFKYVDWFNGGYMRG